MRRSSVQFVTPSACGYGDRFEICPRRASGRSAAQPALQGLALILCVVAHELTAFRAKVAGPGRVADARSGDQRASLLAVFENALLVALIRLPRLEPPNRFRSGAWQYRTGHAHRLQTQRLGPVTKIYWCSRTGIGCWSRLCRRGTLARALRDLLQHQLKTALLLLGVQLLSEIAVIGRYRQRNQPQRQGQSGGQPVTGFCPVFSIHDKFGPRLQRLPEAGV